MEPPSRTFTRAEAEALLPTVDGLLGEAQALAESLARSGSDAEAADWHPRSNGKVQIEPAGDTTESSRRAVARQLQAVIERIHSLGIVVRDIRSGLIDFPSLREGRIVNLCWRRGESLEIRWWHEVEAGFGGRQPL